MSWRPENWKDSEIEVETMMGKRMQRVYSMDSEYIEAFEAGADAILKVLRQIGTPTGLPYTAYANERKGTLVLIPDEPKEGKHNV